MLARETIIYARSWFHLALWVFRECESVKAPSSMRVWWRRSLAIVRHAQWRVETKRQYVHATKIASDACALKTAGGPECSRVQSGCISGCLQLGSTEVPAHTCLNLM